VSDPAPVALDKVVVTPSRFGVSNQPLAVGAALTAADLGALPQLCEDLYRTIARLPGLAADDFTAKFWLRGAPNSQVLARLDGVDLIEPFHLKDIDGALSIVDLPSVSRLDLVTGGFTSDFGDRLAGVLTMETASPSQLVQRTSLGLSLTGLRAAHQGAFAAGRGHWLIAARRGYPDLALKAQGRDDELDPRYYDITAKIEYALTPEHTVSFHALHADDTLKFHKTDDPDLTSSYRSDYVWARWQGTFGEHLSGETVLAFTHLDWHRRGLGQFDQRYALNLRDDRDLDLVTLRQDWSLLLGEKILLRTGFDVNSGEAGYRYDLERDESIIASGVQTTAHRSAHLKLSPERTPAGAYVALRLQPTPALVIEPGLRFDRRDQSGNGNISPRLNAVLTLGHTHLRAAWGLYRQSQGLHELAIEDGDTSFHRSEQAEHRILGLEQSLPAGITLRLEAYERRSTGLRPHWENLDNIYNLFPEVQTDRARFGPSGGRARGVELLLQQRLSPHFTWNASYAYARAEETLAGRIISRARDQRHTFYADASYAPSPKWRFSAAWQFHTGWPITPFTYNLVTLNNGRRVAVRSTGAPYSATLPDYHRLDLRVTRVWQFKRSEVRAYLDLFNVYDRVNTYGNLRDITVQGTTLTVKERPRELLPFLPSVGAAWEF
ncbi:MAG: TonB-dependent receptor, partial [Undibacterium sp.]|nr:TonB-dependent receptor [Opitutaceae bacterium]